MNTKKYIVFDISISTVYIYLFGGAGDLTQGLLHAKCSVIPSPWFFFGDMV
jgi:hypothetical protein